jgi:hypothetical protein
MKRAPEVPVSNVRRSKYHSKFFGLNEWTLDINKDVRGMAWQTT